MQNNQKIKMPWDQSAFEKFKSGWSKERIAEDEKRLQEIFNLAADSPTLKQALDWANAHGIKFYIDSTAENCGGFYKLGMGVVAITPATANSLSFAVQAITHELRHAWQDYYGLYPKNTGDFSEDFSKVALMEADANAFGKRAEEEFKAVQLKKESKTVSPSLHSSSENERADLGEKFLSWFSDLRLLQFYGDKYSVVYGQSWKISPVNHEKAEAVVQTNYEFAVNCNPLGPGINITDLDDVLRLGKSFSGVNYLKAFPRDLLPRKILSPSLAASFYNAANDNQKKLTAELRKCYLRQKLAAALNKKKAATPAGCGF